MNAAIMNNSITGGTLAPALTVTELLVVAERVLADPSSADDLVDRIVADICRLDATRCPDDDQPLLRRVVGLLSARLDLVADELADIGRQRSELVRRHRGVAGYTRSGG